MDKKLKKCYNCLDLPHSATIEDVKARTNALIKIYNSKSFEQSISYAREIEKIESASLKIVENIEKNGIPKEEIHHFDSSWQNITPLICILIFSIIICGFSFYIFI